MLPGIDTPLIGRDGDVAAAESALADGRLLTLWGPAGIGKTRLAIELARRARGEGRSPLFVELSNARSAEAIFALVSDTLDRHTGRVVEITDADGLGRALADHDLVVLDNFEQCAAFAGETVGRWVAREGARFVVTSRERLRLRGERCQELGALSVEDASLQLLTERIVEFGGPSLESKAHREVALSICHALEGIPLAIELAAARAATLGLVGLRDRLGDRLDVLAGAFRDAEPRQATLRGAVTWSWELLDEREQRALAALGVFARSFEAEAAEAILAGSISDPLGAIASLRDKSLLQSSGADGRARLSMFEVVRELAREELAHLPDRDDVEHAHARYFAERAASAVSDNRDDVAAAIRHLARGGADDAKRAAEALLAIETRELRRGPVEDLIDLTTDVLDRLSPRDAPKLVTRVTAARGRALQIRGDIQGARQALEEARDAAIELDDAGLLSTIVTDLGVLHHQRRALADALRCYDRAIALERGRGEIRAQARLLGNLGALHHDQRQFELAEEHYLEALALLEALDDPRLSGITRTNAAVLWQERGDLDDADAAYRRAREELERAGDLRLAGISTGNLASLLQERGDASRAIALHREAIETLESTGDRRSEGLARARLSGALATNDQIESAAGMLAQAEELTRDSDAYVRAAVALHRAFVDLAQSRDAKNESEAREHLTSARRRMDAMYEPAADDRPPPVERSDDVRLALRLLTDLLGTLMTDAGEDDGRALLVSRAGRRYRPPDGEWVDLSRHQVLRRIFLALIEAHRMEPGRGLDVARLTRAAWPGERIRADAAANRVYVSIAKLRRRGLADHLLRAADGYLLDPELTIRRDG